MSIFYLIVAAVAGSDLAWWRWADRRVRVTPRSWVYRLVLGFFVGSQLLYLTYFIVAPRSARRVHWWIPMPFLAGTYIWHLLVMPAAWIGIGISAAVKAAGRLTSLAPQALASTSGAAPTYSRRQALTAAAVAAPPLITALAVARAIPQLDDFRINSIDLAIPGLPPNLDGLRIAHVSDIHVGRYTRRGTLPKIVEATNRLKADLVLFTGDLIDLSLDDLDRGLDAMRQIDPCSGLVMIEGNHDLIEDANAFDSRVKASGIPLLVDEAMTIPLRGERIQLLGTRWGAATGDRRRSGDRSFSESLNRVVPLRDPSAFPIVLAHHPHAFDAVAAAGLPLVLSGHTHGGQLMLSEKLGFGPVFFRYWSGLYRKGNSQLIVSNGVGNWFPLRTHAPAEIIHLTLHPA